MPYQGTHNVCHLGLWQEACIHMMQPIRSIRRILSNMHDGQLLE